MNQKELKLIFEEVSKGNISAEDATLKIRTEPFKDLGFAKLDTQRKLRQGVTEIIYGAGKTPQQIIEIADSLRALGEKTIVITRLNEEKAQAIMKQEKMNYDNVSGIGIIGEMPQPTGIGTIVVATAGTSDIPVAEEAAITAEALGNKVERIYDIGVAGLHRLLNHVDELMSATVIIAIAGMEGALASVIGGLVDCPVIAVPTSVGYGANFDGLSALLSMLNSCASGVTVVNIDNGFGAGYSASMINHMEVKK